MHSRITLTSLVEHEFRLIVHHFKSEQQSEFIKTNEEQFFFEGLLESVLGECFCNQDRVFLINF